MKTWREVRRKNQDNAKFPIFTQEQFQSEIWKPIPTWEGFYEASCIGRIRSLDRICNRADGIKRRIRGRILKDAIDWGYCVVTLTNGKRREQYKTHRLVAMSFIPNPSNLPHVNHIDTIKTHNWAENLEWCTPKQNGDHARENIVFNVQRGENHGMSVFTKEQVISVRILYLSGIKIQHIANSFGFDRVSVHNIVNRKTYNYPEYEPPKT